MVVFDKTGTLTQGKAAVASVSLLATGQPLAPALQPLTIATSNSTSQPSEAWGMLRVLRMLAAVESCSEHPLARAIVDHARTALAAAAPFPASPLAGSAATPMARPSPLGPGSPPPPSPFPAAAALGGSPQQQQQLLQAVGLQVLDFEAVPGRGVQCR